MVTVAHVLNVPCSHSCEHHKQMPLIVFFRGINVGGHRNFRPSLLAKQLAAYEVVNIGAAGTFVVRKPGPRTKFLAELRRKLPFESEIAFCDSEELVQLASENPFAHESPRPDLIHFVSILSKPTRRQVPPCAIPNEADWYVRILGSTNRLVYGVYRRHMKSIGHLSQIDKLFGSPATTRSWSTILSILRATK